MKLNFYFDIPYGITEEEANLDNPKEEYISDLMTLQISMYEIYKKLRLKYPHIKINAINSRLLKEVKCCCDKYNIATAVIENPDNKKYLIISYCDKNFLINQSNGWDLENCEGLYTPIGIHENDINYQLANLPIGYIPSTITTWWKSSQDRIEEIYNSKPNRTIPNKPIFRGYGIHNFRKYLKDNDSRFNIIDFPLDGVDFINEIGYNSINIDVNGAAEISQRTVDILGLGSALIRPKLKIQYHNKLIPNYHYAEVECEDLSNYKELADKYIDKFEELKKDPDQVEFLSKNGRTWYEQNCKLDGYVNTYLDILNINKLFN